jgi:Ca2+:H+ antiporter
MQTSFNLALGSAMASIGLTIPAIAVASIWLDGPLVLGLGSTQTVLGDHRGRHRPHGAAGPRHPAGGRVHLVLFASFLFLA